MSIVLLTAALALVAQVPAAPSPAQSPDSEPIVVDGRAGGALTLPIRKVSGPIRVDGVLDDDGWRTATRAVGWTEFNPGSGVEPPVRTEAWITYDDRYLYVAFVADANPGELRATLRDRDRIWDEDAVGVVLDPHGDAATGSFILANPLGVQADLLFTPQGEDDSYDVIFVSEGRITETGYQVELAIPFRSLRFPEREVQTWRINFYRQHPRSSRHQMSWVPLDNDNPCVLCQSAPVTGLAGIAPGGRLDLLPALVASQSGERESGDPLAPFANQRPGIQASLGAKYALAGGWTAEATLNPDYSQVESDAAQVDVNTTFALSYPERRPFFQEGNDLFDTDVDVVYTRAINAPIAAAKLIGRLGANTRIAYLGARDRRTPFAVPLEERSLVVGAGPSTSNIVRVRHGFRGDSHVGLLFTDRRLDGGGSSTNISGDARLRFATSYSLRAQLVASHTAEPNDTSLTATPLTFGRERSYTAAFDGERFGGYAGLVGLDRHARHFSFGVSYMEASPTYRSDLGFQTRNDFRRVSGSAEYSFYPANGPVERISPDVSFGTIWNFGGERKDIWVSPEIEVALPGQTEVELGSLISRETFRGVHFDGIRRASISVSSSPSPRVAFGAHVMRGRSIARFLETPVLGRGGNAELWGSVKPTQRLVIEPGIAYSRLDAPDGKRLFEGYIVRVRTTLQLSRELTIRVVTQYNDFSDRIDFEPLMMYRLNPFSIFYIGSTHGYHSHGDPHGVLSTDRQIFLKFQYLFRP